LYNPATSSALHLGATLVVSLLAPPATFDHRVVRVLATTGRHP
jgi:hypothetical protein